MSKFGQRLNKALSATSPLMTTMSKVADFILVGLMTVACCIPVVTAGAALSAMYTMAFKIHAGKDSGIWKPFFIAFKTNFKQSTVLWLLNLILFAVIAFDFYFYMSLAASAMLLGVFSFAIFLITSFLTLIEFLYVYAYVAKFQCTNMQAVRSAAYLGLRHIPYTIAMVVFDVAVVVSCLFVPICFIFLPGLVAFMHGLMIARIFSKYIHEDETKPNNDDSDISECSSENLESALNNVESSELDDNTNHKAP